MPKVIENLRENILERAKDQLLKKGYDALNIRAVASECGVAVGTLYNYFSSKEMLAAYIMMEDWLAELERVKTKCAEAGSVSEALRALYNGVSAFSDIYRSVWEGYTFSGSAKSQYATRRIMLVRQLAGCLEPVLARFGEKTSGLSVFLAENVLVCANKSEMTFDIFLGIVESIIK